MEIAGGVCKSAHVIASDLKWYDRYTGEETYMGEWGNVLCVLKQLIISLIYFVISLELIVTYTLCVFLYVQYHLFVDV